MKILAVDDDEIIRELLSEILNALGYASVVLAESGQEALDILEATTDPFDCLLFDIQMPGMDGISLVSQLRNTVEYARTPILMITAMADRKYVDSAFAAGATDYITKPFDIQELDSRLKLIDALVTERKQQQDRNPVNWSGADNAIMNPADTSQRLHIVDVDGVIDYLSLENYLLQMSRAALFGNCVFSVAVKDAKHIFRGASQYEFQFAMTDVAEAISDCLKPFKFFVAHAGEGDFACVRDTGRSFDQKEFQTAVAQRLREMDLYYCDGRPMVLHAVVSEPVQLDWRSSRSSVNALLKTLQNAESEANALETSPKQNGAFTRRLFG
ncbi:CheY-like chemotaxis protein [Sulfitobacter undariae]|uniref:CheY-like chemotaxis protein n=1 Tax=Sulfitobacter undariae TaxID=1563671 RepID=A0A7W6E5K6_9RHOB|nr:response regulator [Sulfitobacter undariae]MBB3995181.1 CheY-like chemotaxis protein [Sulfitobacter undariae]